MCGPPPGTSHPPSFSFPVFDVSGQDQTDCDRFDAAHREFRKSEVPGFIAGTLILFIHCLFRFEPKVVDSATLSPSARSWKRVESDPMFTDEDGSTHG
jgi:hypothetical protein